MMFYQIYDIFDQMVYRNRLWKKTLAFPDELAVIPSCAHPFAVVSFRCKQKNAWITNQES